MTSPFCRPGKRCPASLEERLKKTEEECKQKEEESVNLELELTEVKENLKKALSGGVTLGLSIQPRTQSPGLQVSPAPPAPAPSPSAPLPPPPSASAPILLLLLLVLLLLLLLISLSLPSLQRCCGGCRSLLRSPAVTPAMRNRARYPSTAPRCCAATRLDTSRQQSKDTS